MRNKLKFRHDIFFILAAAGVVNQFFLHIGNWSALERVLSSVNSLIYFIAAVGCVAAYLFRKERLSKTFAVIGQGVSILYAVFAFIYSMLYGNGSVTSVLLTILLTLANLAVPVLLLWAFLRKRTQINGRTVSNL